MTPWLMRAPDKILHRLKPSLERHKGCDIIDVNPGAGLWSSKIHEVVKPRRHLLVEPAYQKSFQPYLQPLLDAPGSKYKLLQWENHSEKRSPKRYLKEGLLPDQKGLDIDSPKTGGCNDSLLFIVNFVGLGEVKGRGLPRGQSEAWMSDWFKAANDEEGFHRNGFVRLLGWMDNGEKDSYVPRTPTDRNGSAFRNDLISHAEEIAGASADERRHRRSAKIEFLSSATALARMEAAGMDMTPDYLDQIPQDILRAKQGSTNFDIDAVIPSLAAERHLRRPWHSELEELEAAYAKGEFKRPTQAYIQSYEEFDDKSRAATSWRRMAQLQSANRTYFKWQAKIDEMVRELQIMDREDTAIRADPTLTEDERSEKLAAIDAQAQAFQEEKVDKLPFNRLAYLASQGDSIFTWESQPKLLTWDHRHAEPLLCNSTDFHPMKSMALIDFQLRDDAIRLSPTAYSYLNAMIWFISYKPSETVRSMLERMHFGAADALLPKCPSLRDPSKGGRRDPGLVTCRSLSREMLVELTDAWQDWVFAPDPTIIMATGMSEGLEREAFKGLKRMLGKSERILPKRQGVELD